ncbi:RecQ family ATP-dependent DNA helicase [Marinoscillum furvescens]|uniref:ATP-dependent DNA helicase RecQ n=1 Tax=Marinoscillum furvescens DSM 4134 TaxID=1122208 RepID=A0A3D9L0S0_MARFU|nr:ATP-dependent DNA helicase RecQ [Marinoscillum furvescens]RED97044.1 ATP-dependent DNA helicase RecQ [Marinoscillum furvescens DSM 4134]
MSKPIDVLKKFWGYEDFRPLQSEIIGAVLDRQTVLALLPTGGGKSICFQVPALCLEGICIVVSPLIALMKDQVEQLKKRGIKAAAIYSGMSRKEIDITLDNCIYGDLKFIYVSPERMKTELFLERARQMTISMLAVDEAHCISQWGYDFRPPYLEIADFIENMGVERVIALTASATREVKKDILDKLGMPEARVFEKSFARANLSYSVFELEHKEAKMLEILQRVPGSSVVYVRSRKQTKEIAAFLRSQGIQADFYHAGLAGSVRAAKQDHWVSGDTRVMVSTNAFGMGIDKPDVRTVIHYDLPDTLEAYYQEAGRAGRDEQKAFAIQLFAAVDLENLQRRTEQSAVSVAFIRKVYQALANYYKLAVGSNAYSSFEFDFPAFTQNFELPSVETYHALNKLSDAGLIELNESFKEQSRFIFQLDQKELYKFQVANRNLDPVIKTLLRLYGGESFTAFTTIKEQDIAKLLQESVDRAIKQLEFLHQAEVIVYQKSSDQPRITFLTPRYDAANLPLDQDQIAWRRKVALDKMNAVKEYVTQNTKCRSRVIQMYFDEVSYLDCGVCDVCLSRHKKQQAMPFQPVLEFLKGEPKSEDEIINHFDQIHMEELVMALRLLLDRKEVLITTDERFVANKSVEASMTKGDE